MKTVALNVPAGTPAKRKPAPRRGTNPIIPVNTKNKSASAPKPNAPANKARKEAKALNPPFDPRMRRVGSPLNLASRIRRGWVQTEDDQYRVNFLFNPSQLDLAHSVDQTAVRQDKQTPPADVMDPFYTATNSTTGVKLLYDRTYELFSTNGSTAKGFANTYGVWADVAAWYVLLGMLDEMPTSWDDSIITQPPQLKTAYLFVGPKMVYYGWISALNVVYSHWTQDMVPARCAVDLSFMMLPHPSGNNPVPTDGLQTGNPETDAASTWLADYFAWQGF